METKKKKTRRKYPEEFKREAVRLLETRGERTVADVASSIARENLAQLAVALAEGRMEANHHADQ